jgi:hypothetical protein
VSKKGAELRLNLFVEWILQKDGQNCVRKDKIGWRNYYILTFYRKFAALKMSGYYDKI